MPPPPPTPLSLQLGTIDATALAQTGEVVWVDLSDGQDVQLAPGAQGGFHVWLLYRVGGNTEMRTLHVQRIADRIGDGGTRQRVLTTDGAVSVAAQAVWQLPMPVPSFMCPTPIGVNVLDAPIELDVRLSEDAPDGQLLGEGKVQLHVHCPPAGDPQHDFCLRICQG